MTNLSSTVRSYTDSCGGSGSQLLQGTFCLLSPSIHGTGTPLWRRALALNGEKKRKEKETGYRYQEVVLCQRSFCGSSLTHLDGLLLQEVTIRYGRDCGRLVRLHVQDNTQTFAFPVQEVCIKRKLLAASLWGNMERSRRKSEGDR